MVRMGRLVGLSLLVACAPYPQYLTVRDPTMVAAQSPLPALLLTHRQTLLWDRPSGGSVAPVRLARLGNRQPLRIVERVGAGYVRVALTGGVEVTGLARLQDLAVMVCVPGPLTADRYAGAGNLLRLSGAMSDDAVGVADTALVPVRPVDATTRYGQQWARLPVVGEIARSRLCDAVPKPRHAGTDADPFVGHISGEADVAEFAPGAAEVDIAADVTLTLLDAPGGQPLLTRAAEPYGFVVVRVDQRGAWDQVAMGDGPYLLGWMPSRPPRQPSQGGLAMIGGLLAGGSDVPYSLLAKELLKQPLRALPAGTIIQQYGRAFATLKRDGWAREGDLQDGWRYVHAAVDGEVMVEGWVRPDVLRDLPPPAIKR